MGRHIIKGDSFWVKLVFTDEKKFNLDIPDRLAFYWQDLEKDAYHFSTKQNVCRSVMVWGPIPLYGVSKLMFI